MILKFIPSAALIMVLSSATSIAAGNCANAFRSESPRTTTVEYLLEKMARGTQADVEAITPTLAMEANGEHESAIQMRIIGALLSRLKQSGQGDQRPNVVKSLHQFFSTSKPKTPSVQIWLLKIFEEWTGANYEMSGSVDDGFVNMQVSHLSVLTHIVRRVEASQNSHFVSALAAIVEHAEIRDASAVELLFHVARNWRESPFRNAAALAAANARNPDSRVYEIQKRLFNEGPVRMASAISIIRNSGGNPERVADLFGEIMRDPSQAQDRMIGNLFLEASEVHGSFAGTPIEGTFRKFMTQIALNDRAVRQNILPALVRMDPVMINEVILKQAVKDLSDPTLVRSAMEVISLANPTDVKVQREILKTLRKDLSRSGYWSAFFQRTHHILRMLNGLSARYTEIATSLTKLIPQFQSFKAPGLPGEPLVTVTAEELRTLAQEYMEALP